MIDQIPFVQRTSSFCPRRCGYSTALSARYDGWAGLYGENHGQHTMILIKYE
nr:MAG TPA: hypothetical protein [Caudoviricetes sp.]